jgi:hypothetical protein
VIAFDYAYELTLGAACALLERPALRSRRRLLAGPCFVDGLLVTALVYAPLCIMGLVGWPGWQMMYLVDVEGGGARAGFVAGFSTMLLFVAYVAGFAAAAEVLRRGRSWRYVVVPLAVSWPIVLVVLFGLLWRRAFTATTHAAFHTGRVAELSWGAPDGVIGGPVMFFLSVGVALNLAAAGLVWARRGGP